MVVTTVTKGRLGGTEGNDILTGIAQNGKGQIHVYARGGEDTINLKFADNINGFSHGHHARGDSSIGRDGKATARSSDTFDFIDTKNIADGTVIVGRLEDFDASDRILIEGKEIDLNDLPSNVRIVEFNGAHTDETAAPQQWILITTSTGGTIFYSLEGARVDVDMQGGANGGSQERHFILEDDLPDFSTLIDVEYVASTDYIPAGFVPDGGIAINDVDQDVDDVNEVIQGSSDGDLIAAGLNDDIVHAGAGDDYIWGGSGRDTIDGGSGNDTINGGQTCSIGIDVGLDDASAQIFRLFEGVFDRAPNEAGFLQWIDNFESGRLSFPEVISAFVESLEYQVRYGNTTNEQFVTLLFNNLFDRDPAAGGLAAWTNVLDRGVFTKAEVVYRFIDGGEFKNLSDDDFYNYLSTFSEVDDVMTGGSGADVFIFEDNFGRDVITDFDTSQAGELIDLSGVDSIDHFTDLTVNHMTQIGQNTIICDAVGNSILLEGVNLDDLSSDDFIF